MKKGTLNEYRLFLLIIIASIIISALFTTLSNKKNLNNFINLEICGSIKKIEFTEKGFPIVLIGENSFYLNYYNEDFKLYIQEKDSLIKLKGVKDIYVYRDIGKQFKLKIFKSDY